jgi:hypothetical protein
MVCLHNRLNDNIPGFIKRFEIAADRAATNVSALVFGFVLEPVFIDETGVYPADFAPAFVAVKFVYPLNTRRFPLPCRTENHREHSPIPLMNTGSKIAE